MACCCPAALYGLMVTHDGAVWFANNGASALVGYAQTNASFIFSQLSQSKDSQLSPMRPISGVTVDLVKREHRPIHNCWDVPHLLHGPPGYEPDGHRHIKGDKASRQRYKGR